jgi:hypothetical protein
MVGALAFRLQSNGKSSRINGITNVGGLGSRDQMDKSDSDRCRLSRFCQSRHQLVQNEKRITTIAFSKFSQLHASASFGVA